MTRCSRLRPYVLLTLGRHNDVLAVELTDELCDNGNWVGGECDEAYTVIREYDDKVLTGRDGDEMINVESVCGKKFAGEFSN